MSISNILERIAKNIRDFKGVMLIGAEGFTVDKYQFEDAELETFVIEFLGMIRKLEVLMKAKNLGNPDGISISGSTINYLLHRVTESYFLFMGVGVKSNLGQCKYELLKAAIELKKELLK